jgi:methyltransferase (TIGR00027 family)
MRSKRPSGTSSLVTLLRALAHEGLTEVRDFKDPTAFTMLPPLWRLVCQFTLRRARRPGFRQRLFNEKSGGKSDIVPLRTRVLDDAWHDARARGTRQLVLLGAGLDGRAFRLDDIGDSTVFEVDHPSTQRLKRKRARRLTSRAQRHLYVPVDFERDKLVDALAASGHRTDAPTFWIWEGVTAYLTRQAQRATVEAIAERSAPGSRLAMTYVEPAESHQDTRSIVRVAMVVRVFGEPFLGLMTRAEAAELLMRSGFRLLEDSGAPEWRRRYSDNPNPRPDTFPERIVIAEKPAQS